MDTVHTQLIVVTASDSFAALWPALAAGCGASLIVTPHLADVDPRSNTVALVVTDTVGIEGLAQSLVASGIDVAVLGVDPDHPLAGMLPYFVLPGDQARVGSWLGTRFDRIRVRAARDTFTAAERAKYRFDGSIGTSAAIGVALARAARAIPDRAGPVLLRSSG